MTTFRSRTLNTTRRMPALGWTLAAVTMASLVACSDDDDGSGGEGGDGTAEGGRAGAGTDAGADAGGSAGDGGSAGADDGEGGTAGGAGGAAGSAGQGPAVLPNPCRGIPLPADQHYVPPGFCASTVAVEQGRLRQIGFASNGDLIGVRVSGEVVRYRDVNADGMFAGSGEIVEIANTGGNGNNAHVDEDGGYLYAGTEDGVWRWAYSPDLDDLGDGEPVVTGQPSSGTHSYHTSHVYDGWLYVHSGSENNAVAPASPEYDTNRSVIKRFDLATFGDVPFEWTEGEVFVMGVRNMVGFTRNAEGVMYGVDNGLDNLMYGGADVHLSNPGENLVKLEAGKAFGYPYCFSAQHLVTDLVPASAGTQLASATDASQPDPDFVNPHDNAWCAANAARAETLLPSHSAPLDIVFYDTGPDGSLPAAWRGGAFVALHGSWNTMPSVGHKVVFVPFDDGLPPMPVATVEGTTFPHVVVFGGGAGSVHYDGIWGWSDGDAGENPVRPVGVAISPIDGALYVSSDNAEVNGGETTPLQGAIYRVGLVPEEE